MPNRIIILLLATAYYFSHGCIVIEITFLKHTDFSLMPVIKGRAVALMYALSRKLSLVLYKLFIFFPWNPSLFVSICALWLLNTFMDRNTNHHCT